MKNSELIKYIKDPVMNFCIAHLADMNGVLPSTLMAFTLFKYANGALTDDDILSNNNITGINTVDVNLQSFDNIENCLLATIGTEYLESELTENQKELKSIVKMNNLSRFDKSVLATAAEPIVDMTAEQCKPIVDRYTVESGDSVVKTDTIEDAKQIVEESAEPCKVFNSRGVLLIDNTTSSQNTTVKSLLIAPGSLVSLQNVNLYYKDTDTKPGRSITGEYKLYDGVVRKHRYAITMKTSDVIIGYINADILKNK